MYLIHASYKKNKKEKMRQSSLMFSKYWQEIEKAIGREADIFWIDGKTITLRWERKSIQAVNRILGILSRFRRIKIDYTQDGR